MSLQTRLTALVQAIGADIKSLNTRLATHKYHAFSNGQYFYDSYAQGNYFRLFTEEAAYSQTRFQPIHNVEYWNGTAWVAWAGGDALIRTLLDGREDTGASIDHAHRRFRFTVQCSSGWGLTALYFLQSTWTGITYTSATVTIEESTSVNGTYTLRDTALFDQPNTASDHGIHAKVTTSLHNGQNFRRVTIDIDDWIDNSSYTTIPLRRFEILSNYSGSPLLPFTWDYAKKLNVLGALNSVGILTENGNRVYSSANPPTGFLPTGGKAADSELLDGIDSLEFLRKGHSDASGSRNTKAVSSLNARLVSGWYDGNNMTGAPDSGWWLVEVLGHSNGSHWQRQIAYSMTGEQTTQSVYSRRCNGEDPTVASNWSSWVKISAETGGVIDAGSINDTASSTVDGGSAAGN